MIYFIRQAETNYIKIGYTGGDVQKRLTQLQTASPTKLELIGYCHGDQWKEKLFHILFNKSRLNGEWFKIDRSIIPFITRITCKSAYIFNNLMNICINDYEQNKIYLLKDNPDLDRDFLFNIGFEEYKEICKLCLQDINEFRKSYAHYTICEQCSKLVSGLFSNTFKEAYNEYSYYFSTGRTDDLYILKAENPFTRAIRIKQGLKRPNAPKSILAKQPAHRPKKLDAASYLAWVVKLADDNIVSLPMVDIATKLNASIASIKRLESQLKASGNVSRTRKKGEKGTILVILDDKFD